MQEFVSKYAELTTKTMLTLHFVEDLLYVFNAEEFAGVRNRSPPASVLSPRQQSEYQLKHLLRIVKNFFKTRNLDPLAHVKSVEARIMMGGAREEEGRWALLEIAFTVCFFSKEKCKLRYPQRFFDKTLGNLSEGYNPLLLTNVFQIVNDTLKEFRIISTSAYSSSEAKELLLNGYINLQGGEEGEESKERTGASGSKPNWWDVNPLKELSAQMISCGTPRDPSSEEYSQALRETAEDSVFRTCGEEEEDTFGGLGVVEGNISARGTRFDFFDEQYQEKLDAQEMEERERHKRRHREDRDRAL